MQIIFTFIVKNIISLKTEDSLKFLGESLEIHLVFAKFLKLIIKDYNRWEFSSTMIDDEG